MISRVNPMILAGLILALAVLSGVIYFSVLAPSRSAQPLIMVSGEWPPYTGEHLHQHGEASAIVSHVLRQMGYQPEYRFMPWSLGESLTAQSQRNDAVRGIFPYISTPEREQLFYFSDSVIEVAYGVYFNQQHNPNLGQQANHEDLSNVQILTQSGYEYAPEFAQHLPERHCPFKDSLQALEHLAEPVPRVLVSPQASAMADSGLWTRHAKVLQRVKPYYLYYAGKHSRLLAAHEAEQIVARHPLIAIAGQQPTGLDVCVTENLAQARQLLHYYDREEMVLTEAIDVVQQLLEQQLPELVETIKRLNGAVKVQQKVMFSRSNPNNLVLRDRFNLHLAALRANPQAYESLRQQVRRRIALSRAVKLHPFGDFELVQVFRYNALQQACESVSPLLVPTGSRAVVREWDANFLTTSPRPGATRVRISLLTGPRASEDVQYCVDGRAIRLP